MCEWIYTTIISWARHDEKVCSPDLNVKIVLLSRATGSISSGNVCSFYIVSSKAREIVDDALLFLILLPMENEQGYLMPKLCHLPSCRTQLIIALFSLLNDLTVKICCNQWFIRAGWAEASWIGNWVPMSQSIMHQSFAKRGTESIG